MIVLSDVSCNCLPRTRLLYWSEQIRVTISFFCYPSLFPLLSTFDAQKNLVMFFFFNKDKLGGHRGDAVCAAPFSSNRPRIEFDLQSASHPTIRNSRNSRVSKAQNLFLCSVHIFSDAFNHHLNSGRMGKKPLGSDNKLVFEVK